MSNRFYKNMLAVMIKNVKSEDFTLMFNITHTIRKIAHSPRNKKIVPRTQHILLDSL